MSEDFYAKLPAIDSFLNAIDADNFVAAPADWYIIVTDIIGSTQAIESGRYKEVNLLGACSIATVLNAVDHLEIPYVFGGDGASFLVPPSLLEKIKPQLLAVRQMAQAEFGLDLRVGIVPIAVVNQAGYEVKLTKLRISENYEQAVFTGGGLNFATELVKSPDTAHLYQLKTAELVQPNLAGLECRWQDILSQHGETISLIVLALAHDAAGNTAIYRDVIQQIYKAYGTEDDFHPIALNNLKLSLRTKRLIPETKVRSHAKKWLNRWLYLLRIQAETTLGVILMKFKLKVGDVDWGQYKSIVQAASDYKKFDDMLRMIIAGTPKQREILTQYLDAQYQAGNLIYGLHVSNRALMTCLVFERNGRQVHFIDGADGGYTLAAKALKEKLKLKAINWQAYNRLLEVRRKLSEQQQSSSPNS
ncbi:MAG: DUF3095 domain-containing protein [Cyanobacteria bacterium Co-bin8]|nr:DUF3095 domain-containing protein [Cyanobacteria bacterium Co-bin8]